MQLAVDKASTDAIAEIGRVIEVKLGSLQKKFADEIGTGDNSKILSLFTEATKLFVSTELNGSQIIKKDIEKEGEGFLAYVLAQYPIGAASDAFMKFSNRKNCIQVLELLKHLKNSMTK